MRLQANPLDVSRYSSVTIVFRLLVGQPRKRGFIPGRGKRFFSSKYPDLPWGTPKLLSRGFFF